jgi:hypothetical protein
VADRKHLKLFGLENVSNTSADRPEVLWFAFGIPPDPQPIPNWDFDVMKVTF